MDGSRGPMRIADINPRRHFNASIRWLRWLGHVKNTNRQRLQQLMLRHSVIEPAVDMFLIYPH